MKRGFTITEILTVVVIFAIVGTFAGKVMHQTVAAIGNERLSSEAYLSRESLVRQMRQDVWHAQQVKASEDGLTVVINGQPVRYRFGDGGVVRQSGESTDHLWAATAKVSAVDGTVSLGLGDDRVVTLYSPVVGGKR